MNRPRESGPAPTLAEIISELWLAGQLVVDGRPAPAVATGKSNLADDLHQLWATQVRAAAAGRPSASGRAPG